MQSAFLGERVFVDVTKSTRSSSMDDGWQKTKDTQKCRKENTEDRRSRCGSDMAKRQAQWLECAACPHRLALLHTGPQMTTLLGKVVEPSGGGASLEEVGH